jgi:myo-inositol-1(or 4)-monophosphatase
LEKFLPSYLAAAQKAVEKTSEYIAAQSLRLHEISPKEKSLNNFVSEVDINAENILVEMLSKALPEAGFITEENSIFQQQKEFTWVIDPLDGTTNFLHGLPFYSISVALMHNEEAIVGVVHDVSRNENFYATKNNGAFLNGKKLNISSPKKLIESLMVIGFFYNETDVLEKFLNIMRHMIQHSRAFRRLGSAALDLAYVASGRCDGFFEFNLNAWDVAAGSLLVKEAGGIVTDFKEGNDFIFGRQIIAARNGTYQELMSMIKNEIGK